MLDCLFGNFSNNACSGVRKEHLIQACIGGWEEAEDVICAQCNNYFSQAQIDQSLGDYFRPITIQALGLLIHGSHRGKKFRVKPLNKNLPLTMERGGGIGMKSIVTESNQEGAVIAVYGPAEQQDVMRSIVERQLGRTNSRISRVPVSEVAPMYKHEVSFDDLFQRSILKCIVETFDVYSRQKHGQSIIRRKEFHPLLRFIRMGDSKTIQNNFNSPMFALDDDLDRFFQYNGHGEFSNRIIICCEEGRIWGMLQIANTMPLGFCLARNLEGLQDFTFLYEQPILVPHRSRVFRWMPTCVLSWQYTRMYGIFWGTPASALQATGRMRDRYLREYGRAIIVADRRTEGMLISLVEHTLNRLNNSGLPPQEAFGRAIADQLRLRYLNNQVSQERWQRIEQEINTDAVLDLPAICAEVQNSNSFGTHKMQVLSAYRTQLETLFQEFSFPICAVLLDSGVGFC